MIEDIDYLSQFSEKGSQIVYIDSSLRNKVFYPNPNDYVVEFDQAFKLVYGFDVIDATIPVTMYNVDAYNNSICFTVVKANQSSLETVDPELYMKELCNCKSFIDLYNMDHDTSVVVGTEMNLAPFLGGIMSPDDESEYYVMLYRTVYNTDQILKKTNQNSEEFYFFKFGFGEYCIKYTEDNQPLIEKLQSGNYFIYIYDTGLVDLIYFEHHNINATLFRSIQTANAHIISVGTYTKTLQVGNYDVLTITNDLNEVLNPVNIDAEPTTSVPKKQGKLLFSSANFILLNGVRGELAKSLGFDTYPFSTSDGVNYKPWSIGDNNFIFGSVFNEADNRYKIIAPGLMSLLGERFAILRIKELEDHLYGSYSYMKMTPGIGMFKMAAPFGGVTNLRFDYTTVITKPFHPIGKLSRLSIRFETSSGNLYDFKGVNHQLMVNVKFYVPTQKHKFSRSILNPHYDPNIMKYMSNGRSIQYREDSDDEEEFDEEKYYQLYKKELDKYDYSSSDEESEDSQQSEETLE